MEARGEEVPRDAFGHVKLDKINPGQWFAASFAPLLEADKVLVQKSGYFARSAAANSADRHLIERCATKAVECGLAGVAGCIGEDEEQGDELRAIEFERIAGGKAFDTTQRWFTDMCAEISQVGVGVGVRARALHVPRRCPVVSSSSCRLHASPFHSTHHRTPPFPPPADR